VNQRLERVAGEVRAVLGEVLARDEIKDRACAAPASSR